MKSKTIRYEWKCKKLSELTSNDIEVETQSSRLEMWNVLKGKWGGFKESTGALDEI